MLSRTVRLSLMLITVTTCGCGAEISPLSRLEKDAPLSKDIFEISDVVVDDKPLQEMSPIHIQRGEAVALTAKLHAPDWRTRKITNSWKYEDGQPHSVTDVGPPPKSFCLLFALIHGNNVAKDLGVVDNILLDVRATNDNDPLEREIRIRFKAPQSRGTYVIDIQIEDQNFGQLERGVKRTKPAGFPIWRSELIVE